MQATDVYVPSDEDLRRILEETETIAIVGLSPKPHRDSYAVAKYLQANGYRIIPVNPKGVDVLDEHCYPSLADVPLDVEIDLVDVFRPSGEAADVTRQAVEAGAKAVWLQLGIKSAEARRTASDAGIDYVEDLCIAVEARRLGAQPPARRR
ncbi:MAG TPA: CoA-binding protein [Actinomycetota bacterium]